MCLSLVFFTIKIEKGRSLNMKPIIGIALGDPAGIGPEITAKALANGFADYTPVLFGNRALYEQSFSVPDGVTFIDTPAGADIRMGEITADGGKLMTESLITAIDYHDLIL